MANQFPERVRGHILANFTNATQYLGSPDFLYRGEKGLSSLTDPQPVSSKIARYVKQGGLGSKRASDGIFELFLSDSMQYSLVDHTGEDGMFFVVGKDILHGKTEGKDFTYCMYNGYKLLGADPQSPANVERIVVPADAKNAIVIATMDELKNNTEVTRRYGKEINFFGDKPLQDAIVGA